MNVLLPEGTPRAARHLHQIHHVRLARAYRFTDSVLVLHEGSVLEAGVTEVLTGKPMHPYTRLLVDSIPWPDLNRRWGAQTVVRFRADAAEHAALVHPLIAGFSLA